MIRNFIKNIKTHDLFLCCLNLSGEFVTLASIHALSQRLQEEGIMKRQLMMFTALVVAGSIASAQVVADFEKNTGGFHVLTQYFGTALTRAAQKSDPTLKSAGVMVLNFNFPPGNAGDKGGVGASNAIVTNGAHFITYWVYMPASTPDSLNISVFAQDNVAYAFHQNTVQAKTIPRNKWYPLSLDLTQAGISDPTFNLVTGNIFLTGIQVDNYAGNFTWQDSMLVDNVALVGSQPVSVAAFESGLGGFANVNFGPALKKVAQVADPTAKSSGVMQLNWIFPADTTSKGAVGLQQSGGLPVNGARFITYWIYLADSTMPDSFKVSVFAQDNKNYAYHDASTLVKNIPKKVWYPLSLDLAQTAVIDPNFDLVAGNILNTGIQIDSYSYTGAIPGWKDSLYVDNVALLTYTVPPPLKKLVVDNFETQGDVGLFSTQSFGPAFTALANGIDTTNAANRVLVVTAAFDTGTVKTKGAISRSNFAFFKQGDTSATDITFDVFVPASMPDSALFDLVLSGPATGNAWVQDEFMLGSPSFQKGAWNTLDFSVSKHIADHTITSPRLTATFYVQVYYKAPGKKWSGKMFFDNLTLLGIDALTGVAQNPATPYEYRLYNNYPNPFNPSTMIRYDLKQEGPVSLKIYDVLGREVATLVSGRQPAGPHSVVFDAGRFATGAYFYTLRAGSFVKTEKMMLVK